MALVLTSCMTVLIVHGLATARAGDLARHFAISSHGIANFNGPAMLFVYAAGLVASGFYIDRGFHKVSLAVSALLVTLGAVLVTQAKTFDILWLALALENFGEAGTLLATIAILWKHTFDGFLPAVLAFYAALILVSPATTSLVDVALNAMAPGQRLLIAAGVAGVLVGAALLVLPMALERDVRQSGGAPLTNRGARTWHFAVLTTAAGCYLLAYVPLLGWAPAALAKAPGWGPAKTGRTMALVLTYGIPMAVLLSGPVYAKARARSSALPLLLGAAISMIVGSLALFAAFGGQSVALVIALVVAPAVNPLFLFLPYDLMPPGWRSLALGILLFVQIICGIALSFIMPLIFDAQGALLDASSQPIAVASIVVVSASLAAVCYLMPGIALSRAGAI